jgi:hypothetical protein
MIICPHCAHQNREGTLICGKCEKSLKLNAPDGVATHLLDESNNELAAKATWGKAEFSENNLILLRIRNVEDPITIQPAKKIILGRSDNASSQKPDLDLTPYGALDMGISRIHAAINRNEGILTLVDMGSANGTHLNGQRLAPDHPRVLRDGDEIRLGNLVTNVYFK